MPSTATARAASASASEASISTQRPSRTAASSAIWASVSASCAASGVGRALGLLEPFHDLELGVLQRGDPTLERLQLVLHALEVLGVADQALVHPVAVARAPHLDLLDVGVGLLLLDRQVVDDDAGVAQAVVDVTTAGLQLGDADDLRAARRAGDGAGRHASRAPARRGAAAGRTGRPSRRGTPR